MKTLATFCSLIAIALGLSSEAKAKSPSDSHNTPNVIIILADDMGYGDVGAFNPKSEIPTPHLDKLAATGTRFTDAHTPSSICTPTRYGLLTGRYCWRTWLKNGVLKGYDTPLIERDRATVASYLKGQGYHTGIVGKWHLGLGFQKADPGQDTHSGFDLTKPLERTPNENGFDYSFVLPASLDFEPYLYVRNKQVVDTDFEHVPTTEFPHFWREGIKSESLEFDQVLDDFVVEAKQFIKRGAEGDKPFFLYFPLTAPHKPISPAERFVGESDKGLYGDFIMQIDWSVGEITTLLESLDIADDTLVIFTCDNGSAMYRKSADTYPDHTTDETLDYYNETEHLANGPLRGIKGDAYEGGHRVPFIATWPAGIPANHTVEQAICLTDIFDTLVSITGGTKPANSAEDSFSFASLAMDKSQDSERPPIIHHSGGKGMFAIRDGDWKLILGNGSGARTKPVGSPFEGPYQLYNIEEDIAETDNKIEEHPEIAARLEAELYSIKGDD